MAKVWKIAPGERAENWELFREHGCIGLGWLPKRDYGDFENEDGVLSALEQEYGKGKRGAGVGAAEMIWRFVDEIKTHQTVVANDGYNRVVGIGTVESEYLAPKSRQNPIRNDKSTHRHHVRLVNWLITKPVDLPGNRFFVQSTLWPLEAAQLDQIRHAYLLAYPDDSETKQEIDRLFGSVWTPRTREASDLNEPQTERIRTTTYRVLRDTELARRVKEMHNYECQTCGHTIVLSDGSRYAESHHIKPLGSPHNGPDIIGNILCLCPNHHAECDLGVSALSQSSFLHVDGHDVDERFIEYHNRKIHGSR
jgi:hypothetical protein